MTEIILSGDGIALEIAGEWRTPIREAAEALRFWRENPTADDQLWALHCAARAWGTMPTVLALRD